MVTEELRQAFKEIDAIRRKLDDAESAIAYARELTADEKGRVGQYIRLAKQHLAAIDMARNTGNA